MAHSDFAGTTFWRGAPDAQKEITVHVNAGEVRYVGTLSYKFDISPGTFSIRIKDRYDRIASFVEEQLGGLGQIRTMLAKYEETSFRKIKKQE